MARQIKYGEFLKEAQANHREISYNKLTPKEGEKPKSRIKLRRIDVYRLLQPYLSIRFFEQLKAVVPLAIYLILFQVFMLRQEIEDSYIITFGLFAVIIGLMFFMEGLKLGLMPFGETIGNKLPKKVTLPVVLFIAFLLGIGVTFAEPAIGALKAAGALVSVQKAPYLYMMLNEYSGILVLLVGAGVGLAAVLGTLRFIYDWSLKPYIYLSLVPTLLLTIYVMNNDLLVSTLGLAWDCGAVTTGPVTVPLVLALGIGIASASGKGGGSLSGFGIVTLASLFPIIAVLSLSIYLSFMFSPAEIIASVQNSSVVIDAKAWWEQSPSEEIILGFRAIVPLVIFLFIVLKIVLKENIQHKGIIIYGLVLTVVGMMIFNLGLTYGLSKLGGQSGGLIPAAFNDVVLNDGSIIEALYPYALGLSVALLFAWILGFGATLAEPALNALGLTVENLTQGAFKKRTLMYAVSIGVGTGIMIGVLKIIFNLPIGWLLVPTYLIAVILTYFSSETFVNIAWDSAGVTTGPITVPLVLAMGLGFGNALGVIEGFGILSMASIGPIIAVLSTGIWINLQAKRHIKKGEN